MRALRVASRQRPEISYEEMPLPDPGIGDVLVEVKAASFTPTELQWPSTWVDPPATIVRPLYRVTRSPVSFERSATARSV